MTTTPQDATLALAASQHHHPESTDLAGILQALDAEATPDDIEHTPDVEEALDAEDTPDAAHTTPAPPTEEPLPASPTIAPPLPAALPKSAVTSKVTEPPAINVRFSTSRQAPKAAKEEPLGPMPDGIFGIIDELLRDQNTLIRRLEAGQGLATIARAMLITVGICALAVGASVGFYRGGEQIFYAAVKLPVVILMTVAICAPAYSALKAALQQRVSIATDFALVLSALALASLVVMSLAPLLLLAAFQATDYHDFILLVVALCGLGGAVGYTLFFRGMHRQVHSEMNRRLIAVSVLIVLGLVSTQMTWIMRPYAVRPQTVEVPFLRPFEGSFINAVLRSTDSARGIYRSERATPTKDRTRRTSHRRASR